MEAKISVLLADASGDLRLLLRETLESTGEFQVVGETGDGGQVLALVEETHPQLLLLDAMLPVLDGMGVLRQLREREEQPRTIVTSAFYNDRMVAEAGSNQMAAQTADVVKSTTSMSLKLATMVVTTLPIVCVYPFLQKYFVKGMMIGAVKG